MAPTTYSRRFALSLGLFLLAASAFLPYSVSAAPSSSALPDLASFTLAVENGDANVLRGVYADGLFALPVVQQPTDNTAYVSAITNTVTQFSVATQYGNIGLLAHNYLGGQSFFQLMPGQRVQLIYGDGRIENFQVTRIYRYQATSPSSVYSDFIDLDTQEHLSANALFAKVYMGSRHITFQTCITRDTDLSWGRLFIIAEPEPDSYPTTQVTPKSLYFAKINFVKTRRS